MPVVMRVVVPSAGSVDIVGAVVGEVDIVVVATVSSGGSSRRVLDAIVGAVS